ncbi:MAG: M48 family metallopeptidase [Betaproteobacteria bacterium]|nr:M48 family metallopeptidase [Betaproteobacteria bacterium]
MHTFGIVFLAALALATATRLWLARRHVGHVRAHRGRVPENFAAEVDLAAHQRAADYTCAKTRFTMVDLAAGAVIVLVLTFGGGLQLLHGAAAAWLAEGIARELLFVALVAVVVTLVDIPFDLYRTFAIEQRFGFNRMTPGLFFIDLVKSLLVGAVLGLPLVAAILWLIRELGAQWWLYAWGLTVLYGIVAHFIFPTVIAPLFNKFSPMDNPELKDRIERLLARCGFKVKGLMVMDGSRRSSHGNAYFTGFGASRRIVFFDTLLAQLAPAEVEAVLAHELGHFRLRHVLKRMTWSAAFSFGFFWLLSFLMAQEWFYTGLGVASPSPAMALVLFLFVVPPFTFLLQPLGALYSRKHEYEADQYAARNASARDLVSALIKLYRDNAATLTPDPLHSAFYDSHPPAVARIARLQKA